MSFAYGIKMAFHNSGSGTKSKSVNAVCSRNCVINKVHNSGESSSSFWGDSLPQIILEHLFSYLEIEDLRNCALVCTTWYR